MSFFEDGFFGLNLEDDTPVMKAMDLSILAIAFLIQISIGSTALCKMWGNVNMNTSLIWLFVSSLCFSCVFAIGGLLDDVGGDHIQKMIEFVTVVSYGYFFQSLLWTLVARLHITFKPSHHQLSWRMGFVFTVIIFIELLGWIVFCALFVFMEDTCDPLIPFSLGLSLLFLYMIGSGLAVYLFLAKLSKLAKDRERSLINLNLSARHIELDQGQQRIAKLSAKYLMLFGIAMASTILMHILSYSVNIGSGLRSPILAVDVCINLLTVDLQFAAMGYHYQRWCGCCHAKVNKIMVKRVQSSIYETSMQSALSRREEENPLNELYSPSEDDYQDR